MPGEDLLLPSVLDQTSKEFGEQLKRLIMPAMGVIEAALISSDVKLRVETAKWVLSCYPETAPKKPKEDESGSGAKANGVNVNLNFNMEKFKHIAEGVAKVKNAEFRKISEDEKLLPVHRKGNDEDGTNFNGT